MAEIDSLEIKIGASSNTAVEKINAIASSLEKLKKAGGGDLSETAKKIEAIARATSSLKGNGEDVKKFADGLKSLEGLGRIKIPDKLAEKLTALSEASQGIPKASENLSGLANAINGLSNLGKVNIPKTLPDRILDIGAAVEQLSDESIKQLDSFTASLQRLSGIDLKGLPGAIRAVQKSTSGNPLEDSIKKTISDAALQSIKTDRQIYDYQNRFSSLSDKTGTPEYEEAKEKLDALKNAAEQAKEQARLLKEQLDRIKSGDTEGAVAKVQEISSALKDAQTEAKIAGESLKNALQKASDVVVPQPEVPTSDGGETGEVEPGRVEDTSSKLGILSRAAELAKASIAALEAKFPALAKAINIAGDAASKFGSALKSAGRAAGSLLLSGIKSAGTAVANDFISPFKNAVKAVSTWKSAIGRIAFYRIVRSAIKAVTDGFKTGIEDLYQYSTMVGTSFAPAMNQLATSSLYLKNSLGAMAAPLIQAVSPAIDFVIDKFVALLNVIGKVFAALSGRSTYTQAVKKAATYGDDLNKSMGGAAKSAKEFQRYLIGIDELNIINDPNAGNGGGGGGGAGGGFGDMFEEVEIPAETLDWAAQFRKAIEDGEWYKAGEILGNKLNEVVDGLDTYSWGVKLGEKINAGLGIAYGFLKTFDFTALGAKTAEGLNGIFDTVDWDLLGKTFAAKWNALFDFIYGFSTTLDWASIGRAISDTINGFFAEIDLKKAAAAFSETVKGILDTAIVAVGDLDVSTISEKLVSWIGSIDWTGIALRLGGLVQEVIAQIPVFILGALAGISDAIGDAFENIGLDSVAGLFHGISDGLSNIAAWVKKNFVDPIVKAVKNLFGIHSPSTVFADIGDNLVSGLLQGISGKWSSIVDFFAEKLGGIKKTVSDAWSNIKSTASDKWGEIKTTLGTAWDNLKSAASTAFENIKSAVTTANDDISSNAQTTWDTVNSNASSDWETMKANASTVFGTISTTLAEKNNEIKANVSAAWSSLKADIGTSLSNISTSISSTFTNLVSKATSWGRDLCSNIANGIKGAVGTVTSAASNLAGKIKSYVHFSEPDVGPLSDFHTYMPDMLQTMAKGIRDNTYLATNAVSELAGSVSKQFSNLSYDVPKPKFSNVTEMQMNYQVAYAGGYQDPQSGNYAEAAGGTNADVVNAILAMATQIVTAINEKDTSVNIDGERLTRRISSLQAQQERMYRR